MQSFDFAIAGARTAGRALAARIRAAATGGLFVLSGLLGAGPGEPAQAGGPSGAVTLRIANDGAEALRCVVLFGHWITRDLGIIDAGASDTLAIMRDDGDGSLYILRGDGREMMIENVVCGVDRAWAETLGQLDLLPVRESREREFRTSCRIDERLDCTPPRAD